MLSVSGFKIDKKHSFFEEGPEIVIYLPDRHTEANQIKNSELINQIITTVHPKSVGLEGLSGELTSEKIDYYIKCRKERFSFGIESPRESIRFREALIGVAPFTVAEKNNIYYTYLNAADRMVEVDNWRNECYQLATTPGTSFVKELSEQTPSLCLFGLEDDAGLYKHAKNRYMHYFLGRTHANLSKLESLLKSNIKSHPNQANDALSRAIEIVSRKQQSATNALIRMSEEENIPFIYSDAMMDTFFDEVVINQRTRGWVQAIATHADYPVLVIGGVAHREALQHYLKENGVSLISLSSDHLVE